MQTVRQHGRLALPRCMRASPDTHDDWIETATGWGASSMKRPGRSVRAFGLAVLLVLGGCDSMNGVLAGIAAWQGYRAYADCVAKSGQDDWECEDSTP